MQRPDPTTGTRFEWLCRHLGGHIFLFEARPKPAYDSSAGIRLLLTFVLLELVIGPRASLLRILDLPLPPAWLRVPILLILAMILIRFFARLKLSQLGLHAWRDWGMTQKSYFLQAILIANVVFCLLLAARLQATLTDPDLWGQAVVVAFTNLLWGFYQELVYRGILQTELARRWGSFSGILVSNLLFTFGPLHFYYFSSASGVAWLMLAGIFSIGLFFGVLFRRSGNLVIVGVLHGLGNCYMDGLGELGRRV